MRRTYLPAALTLALLVLAGCARVTVTVEPASLAAEAGSTEGTYGKFLLLLIIVAIVCILFFDKIDRAGWIWAPGSPRAQRCWRSAP